MRAELGFNRLDVRLWLNPTIDCDIHIHYHDLNWNAEMSSEMQVQESYLIIRTGLYCRYLHTPPPPVIQLSTIKSELSIQWTNQTSSHSIYLHFYTYISTIYCSQACLATLLCISPLFSFLSRTHLKLGIVVCQFWEKFLIILWRRRPTGWLGKKKSFEMSLRKWWKLHF